MRFPRCSRLLAGLLTGVFLFSVPILPSASETVPETEPAEAVSQQTELPEELTLPAEAEADLFFASEEPAYAFSAGYNLYFGLLHAHTSISDGLGTVEEAFSYASAVEGMDFFAVTDHSNSFDGADLGSLTADGSQFSTEWAAGKAAAAAVTTEDFLGIFGFEMTWPEIRQLGHITTYNTPGWLSRDQAGFADDPKALAHYFEALAEVPGSVSQLCHPGSLYGDFDRFHGYRPEYDDSVQLLEVLGEGSIASYIQALDAHWHLAPTASQNCHNGSFGSGTGLRTVVLAEKLTEEDLFSAIRARRVYATEDADLHLSFALDGEIMGSRLLQAEEPEIAVSLYDPTDSGGSTLEVIAAGGVVLAEVESAGNEDMIISVPGGYRWYFLKVTQADGDVAVTAPVWVEGFENMGIGSFTCDTAVPVQDNPITLELELFNEESADFCLTSLTLYVNDAPTYTIEDPGTVRAGERLTCPLSYTHTGSGTAELRVLVRGTVLGRERSYEASLSLRFRPGETVSGLLIDGSHGNAGLDSLTRLKALAGEAGMDVTVFADSMPLGGRLLVIPPLRQLPGEGFLADAAAFLESGGSLILMADPDSAGYGSRLLEVLGSSLSFSQTTVPQGSSKVFAVGSEWWSDLSQEQYFLHPEGCAVEPGNGQWLVKDSDGSHILLACEKTPYGGTVFAAGSPFMVDRCIPESVSVWDLPEAGQVLLQAILGTAQPPLEEICIYSARQAPEGTVCRIRGYVTGGTSDAATTFPDAVYIQDDTGGIAVAGLRLTGIQIGTPMEFIGVLQMKNGVPTLIYTDHRLPETAHYAIAPRTLSCKTAMEYDLHGGELVLLEGTVTDLTLTADRAGVSRIVIKDHLGDSAIVEIGETIGSGATGKNTLAKTVKKGRAIRVIGLVHINEAGETVLRVRNCDEVVYLPPSEDPTNPRTADPLGALHTLWHRLSSSKGLASGTADAVKS